MAWSLCNDHIDQPSISWQYEPGNGDSTSYKDMTATQTPIVTVAKPLSTEHSFYDPRVQHASALLDPNFTSPSTLGPLNLDYTDQDSMQGFLSQWNSTTEGPARYHRHLAESMVRVPSLDSPSSVEEPSPSKDSDMPTTQGNHRGPRANKQE